ncbi:MAG: tetratricopeptide repeat protein [Thermodesulfovibrionales bacterium]
MKAILSGQTAVAVCIQDDQFYSISIDSPENWSERQNWEIPILFANATDMIQLENTSRSQVLEILEVAWAQDRSLQLILILLDQKEESETRREAAECLDEFFNQAEMREYVENHLYSAPLSSDADLNGAIEICAAASLAKVMDFLDALQSDQEEISKRVGAWEALPIGLFDTSTSKQDFHCEAVKYGAFRIFVTERHKKNLALVQLLSHPHFRGNSKARNIFQKWSAHFKEAVTNSDFESREFNDGAFSGPDDAYIKRRVSGFDAFQQVEKQKEAIKQLLSEGTQDLALRFTEELVASQRRNSKPEHIAKSLCDLAQFAKGLGSPELQLEFALKAVKEAPDDAWSYATLGDAYRWLSEYPKSLKMYHKAGVYGNRLVALTGRAEVLKDIGQLEESLEIYEQCILEFPDEIVTQNGRAAALANYGKLEKALEAYDTILRQELLDPVTVSGRAQVLREMGRLDESLAEFSRLSETYPQDIINQNARADVLRELGRLEDAEIALSDIMQRFPLAAGAKTSHARILRDLGRFDDALDEYKECIKKFPLSPWVYIGMAETYRKIGNLAEALKAYELCITKFPRSSMSRNGKASVLVAMGDYSAALSILPKDLPASQSEWVAYHIIGMAHMRTGHLDKAEPMFEWGSTECPWVSQREYFKTALASLRIQQKRYDEVAPLVQKIIYPFIEPIAHVLIMHASGELGNTLLFEQSYGSIRDIAAPVVIELRDALAKRYKQKNTSIPPDSWFFLRECDSLLLAA